MKQIPFALLVSCYLAAGLVCAAESVSKNFTVERSESGVWWFVDPQGKNFVSLGVSDIPAGPTREKYDPENPGYAAFRYYDSTDDWHKSVRQHLKDWEFNTIGAWADSGIANDEFPETRVLHWGSSLHAPWCDVFSHEVEDYITKFAAQDVAPHKDDANLIGWFTDNELQWYADTIFAFHLHNEKPSRTREKLIELFRENYKGDFSALQKDFDVAQAAHFEELGHRGTVTLKPLGQGLDLVNKFTFLVAERYYQLVHDAIRKHDTNHLILGDRYMSYCPPVVARAAGPYIDVISTNFDWPDWMTGNLPTHYLQMLHDESGKPVLITEWYVAAKENRSGNRNRGVSFTIVPDQEQRAITAERRLAKLLSEPYIVGAHWFRYADEPTNGRSSDGEDFNFGLVDIHDKPYEKLVASMRRVNQQANEIHARAKTKDDSSVTSVAQHASGVDFPGNVEHFSPVVSQESSPLADLRVAWDENQLYIGLVGFRFVDPQLFANEKVPASHHQRLSFKLGDNLFALSFDPDTKPNSQQAQVSMVETRHRHLGVRFTYLIKVPASKLPSIAEFQKGAVVPFEATLRDPSGQATRWQASLVLADEAERLAEQVSADEISQ